MSKYKSHWTHVLPRCGEWRSLSQQDGDSHLYKVKPQDSSKFLKFLMMKILKFLMSTKISSWSFRFSIKIFFIEHFFAANNIQCQLRSITLQVPILSLRSQKLFARVSQFAVISSGLMSIIRWRFFHKIVPI